MRLDQVHGGPGYFASAAEHRSRKIAKLVHVHRTFQQEGCRIVKSLFTRKKKEKKKKKEETQVPLGAEKGCVPMVCFVCAVERQDCLFLSNGKTW